MTTIGVAVPCYHGHIGILKFLLDSIEKQTRKPDMVVVSCSGVSDSDIPYKQEDYSFPLKIVTIPIKLNSAQNRNNAARLLNTKIISFIDADDQMHPQRLEVIEKAFKENDIVLLLHNYVIGFDKKDEIYDITNVPIHFGRLKSNTEYYYSFDGDAASGHVTVTNEVFKSIQFREAPFFHAKEDNTFNAEIIKKYQAKCVYCPLVLSKYVPSHTHSFVG